MSTRRALSTVVVASFLVLSGLTAGVTGTAAASNASGNTVFTDQPTAYQSGAGESDTTVTEGDSVTVDVPVTDGFIAPDTAEGESWTFQDAPAMVAGSDRAWTSENAVGDRFYETHVSFAEQRTVDEVTVETGGNVSKLYFHLVEANVAKSVDVTDGTATLSVSDASTDEIVFYEKDDATADPFSVVDVRASNDGASIKRTGWTTEVAAMENVDVSEALDGDDDPWTSPTSLAERGYGLSKVFDEEQRIDGLTLEHQGGNYPSTVTVNVLGSNNSSLTKTVPVTGETTTVEFEAIDAKTVTVAERDGESSDPWAVSGLRYHRASSKTVESVRINASALGLGTVEAKRDGSGEYAATFTPEYAAIPDGNYTLPVTATAANGTKYETETVTVTVDTKAPLYTSQPGVSDGDGDGIVRADETVTVRADFDAVEPTISTVTSIHENVSNGSEAADGDDTPWTSEHAIDERLHGLEVHFANERTIDEIEIETEHDSSLGVNVDTWQHARPDNGTATLELDGPATVSSFRIEESEDFGTGRFTVSDVNAYHDGERLDESNWSVKAYAVNYRNVTSDFTDESATWSARSPIDENVVALRANLSRPTTVDEVTINHANDAVPSDISVFSGGRPFFLTTAFSASQTTSVSVRSPQTEQFYMQADADETDQSAWKVADLDVSAPSNDDVERVTIDARSVGAGTLEATAVGPQTYEATFQPENGVDGQYAFNVTAVDEAGNSETMPTNKIAVETTGGGSDWGSGSTGSTGGTDSPDDGSSSGAPPSNTDPGGGGTTGGSGSGGGGGAIPVGGTDRPEMVVETVTVDGTTNVSITHARSGSDVTIEPNVSTGTKNATTIEETVALDAVSATVASEGNYSVAITENESLPAGAERFDLSGSEPALGYVQVDHAEVETFDDVTFEFRLSTAALDDRDIEAGDAALYRYSDGNWKALDTSVVSRNGTWVTYEADSPGFSTFAVGTEPSPSLNVTDAALSADAVAPGDRVVVEAVVENDGDAAGSSTVELTLDGESKGTKEVSLDAGGTTTVKFETSVADAGQYDVTVNGTNAGTLSVGTDTPSSTPTATATDESDADGTSLMPVALGLVALLGGVGAFRYLRD